MKALAMQSIGQAAVLMFVDCHWYGRVAAGGSRVLAFYYSKHGISFLSRSGVRNDLALEGRFADPPASFTVF
jgi:hypothetical protein